MKTTVAILGSCVTRDIFISKTNPKYKKKFELVLFQNHTTLLSLLSPKIEYDIKDFSNLNWRNLKMIKDELDKNFLTNLKEIQPNILVMDFFSDAFFDTIKDKNSYLTVNTWKTTKTRHYENISSLNKPFKPTIEIQKQLIIQLSDFLKSELPNTIVILNKTKTVKEFKNENGKIFLFKKQNDINKEWKIIDELFIKIVQPFVINDKHNYIGDLNHVWGLSNVHYEKEYYINSLKEIKKILKKKKKTNPISSFLSKIWSN